MKIKLLDNGVITEKTIHTDKEICGELLLKRHEHVRECGFEPEAFLLGPNEYLRFVAEIREHVKYPNQECYVYHTTFHGIPVRIKRGSGIDLEIKSDHAFRFAKGTIE